MSIYLDLSSEFFFYFNYLSDRCFSKVKKGNHIDGVNKDTRKNVDRVNHIVR